MICCLQIGKKYYGKCELKYLNAADDEDDTNSKQVKKS